MTVACHSLFEQVMAGMYLAIQKDITGSILFLVKEEVALHLVKKLMGDYAQDIRGEMEQSALKEISNIITGAYLNALSIHHRPYSVPLSHQYHDRPCGRPEEYFRPFLCGTEPRGCSQAGHSVR